MQKLGMSALPRTNDPDLEKAVTWTERHSGVSELRRQNDRASVGLVDLRPTDQPHVADRHIHCWPIHRHLLADNVGKRSDLGMAVPPVCAIDTAQRSRGRQMSRPPKKQTAETTSPRQQHRWAIYHIKGTPAKLLGHVEAPDEESAIKKAIEEFRIAPQLQSRLLAQRP
jgi:hypothetical protein